MRARTNASYGEYGGGTVLRSVAGEQRIDERRFVAPRVFNAKETSLRGDLWRQGGRAGEAARAGDERERRATMPPRVPRENPAGLR